VVAKDTQAKLVWYIWSTNTGVRGEAYTNIAAAFQREYPNVSIEQISGGSFPATVEKLITLLAAGESVDLVGTKHDVLVQYVNHGFLKDLTGFARRDPSFKFTDHVPVALDMLTLKGRVYGLPIGITSGGVVYNADLFAKLGVKPPDGSWTWKDYLDLAQRLTVRREDSVQWGTHAPALNVEIYPWIWMNGGEPFTPKEEPTRSSFVQAETLQALEWFMDLHLRYGVKPPYEHPDGKGVGVFPEGRVAFYPVRTNNMSGLQNLSFNWDVAPFPKGKKGAINNLASFSYGIYDKTRNEDLAWRFWTFVVGAEGQREWMSRTGEFVPSLKSLQVEYEQRSQRPANRKVFTQGLAAGRSTPKTAHWVDVERIADEQLLAADAKKISVRAALESIDRQLATVLGR
jgi:multiple sugar transport system substrate-binding protein